MLDIRKIISKNGGAVSGTVASVLSVVTAVAAVTVLSAAKLSQPGYTAYICDNGTVKQITTHAQNADDFVTEQRAKMHPYDKITYVGVNDNGEFELTVERSPYVTVNADGIEKNVRAVAGETVNTMLRREKIHLDKRNAVYPSGDSRITGNCEVTIERGFPVNIIADGEEKTYLAAGITVGELLVRENYSLSSTDEVNVPLDEIVRENMKIQITRVEYVTREKSENIAYETEYEDSPLMKIGDTDVVTEGVDGNITITIRDKYVNGIKLSSEVADTKITQPINEVIARGTALNDPISKREGSFTLENGIPTDYAFVLEGKVTAYTARAGSGTYSGRPLVVGSIGVDPDVIPFGSEVYIVSKDGTHVYGYAVASDTGDLKNAGVLADAYMGITDEHYADACAWGAQFCYVYVLTVGDNSVSWR